MSENKIAESLGGHMYSIEELAAWRVESINRIHALETALREARAALTDRVGPAFGSYQEIKLRIDKTILSIDALLGKEGK